MSTIRSMQKTIPSPAKCLAATIPVACLILSMLAVTAGAQEPFHTEATDETITVSSAGRPVLEYQLAPKPKKEEN